MLLLASICIGESKRRRNPCCTLSGQYRRKEVSVSLQAVLRRISLLTPCFAFMFCMHDRKSKGQCVYSTFRSSITRRGEFSMEFCPNIDKSSQQTPREASPTLGAFKQYGAHLQNISWCLVKSFFHLSLHRNINTVTLFSFHFHAFCEYFISYICSAWSSLPKDGQKIQKWYRANAKQAHWQTNTRTHSVMINSLKENKFMNPKFVLVI